MAYTTIDDPSAYFQTKLYTGTGSSLAITNDGNSNLQPDLVWLKRRDGSTYDHRWNDSVRGVSKTIYSSDNFAENTSDAQVVTSFNSNGFTLGTSAGSNASGVNNVAWQWKAGTSVSGNTGGSGTAKTYTGSVSTASGFSIIKYVGNGTGGHTIPHNLGSTPQMLIIKNLSGTTSWVVYHHKNTSEPETDILRLDTTAATADDASMFNDTAPTSTVFTLGSTSSCNLNDSNYICYAFCGKKGYSKFSSYIGNGSTNGQFSFLGFKPAMVILKRTDSSASWLMFDNKRDIDNVVSHRVYANGNYAEDSDTGSAIDFLSNGFKNRSSDSSTNASGGTYIYMAFAESPFVTSTGIPTTAR